MEYDVVVVGGGAAGLSAGIALARSRRSVLVVDASDPRNAPAAGVHNYLGREGTPPGELYAAGRADLQAYGGALLAGTATAVSGSLADGFAVSVEGAAPVRARRVLVTTGLSDVLPPIPGLAERWGRDVLHCPYCHGWEVRDQRIGVLATSPLSAHQVQLFRQLSPHVTLLLNDAWTPDDEQAAGLAARGIDVVAGAVAEVCVEKDRLTGVRLRSGEVVALDAVAVGSTMVARSSVLESLGLEPVDLEMGGVVIGRAIPVDATGATSVPGVYAAGNVTDVRAMVVSAAAGGLMAGAMVNADLVAEDVRRAVVETSAAQAGVGAAEVTR